MGRKLYCSTPRNGKFEHLANVGRIQRLVQLPQIQIIDSDILSVATSHYLKLNNEPILV